tara:strand:+ start:185 stop:403 length:219 start_codon:yes stop_codon:yes gene_type:complete
MALKDWKKSKQYEDTWFKGNTQKQIRIRRDGDSEYGKFGYGVIYDWGNKQVSKQFKSENEARIFAKAYMRKH